MTEYNATCDAGFDESETLAALRRDLLVRLGYSAQADSPPPGMADLLNSFLKRGQTFLYKRYAPLQTERWFKWPMTVGERFYGVKANTDACSKKVLGDRISEVWIEDTNGSWSKLTRGIGPANNTNVLQNGLPCRYEVRQAIEVFPAPDKVYTLYVRGHFGVLPFTADGDKCTVDSELLFLWALGNAKNHYGQPDGADIAQEAQTMLKDIIAAAHTDRRYIPGEIAAPVASRPQFAFGVDP